MTEGWGFADIYDMDASESKSSSNLADVQTDDWRNIMVLGRATPDGVYPETLALVGRARHLADELGCRVEVLLIGEELEAATEVLKRYAIDNIYRVSAPTYAPIDQTAKILEGVVRKRRPELVMIFQSRTGDAVTAYTANRLGAGFVIGATSIEIDTYERHVRATHVATNERFQMVTEFRDAPQFVSVRRGLFRAPMEDSMANVHVYDLDIDVGRIAAVEVLEKGDPPAPTLANAARVVIAGARCRDAAEVDGARALATKIGAVFGISRSVLDRGLGKPEELVGWKDQHIQARLIVTVGVRGSLDIMASFDGDPAIAAIGNRKGDPIIERAAYVVMGDVDASMAAFVDAL